MSNHYRTSENDELSHIPGLVEYTVPIRYRVGVKGGLSMSNPMWKLTSLTSPYFLRRPTQLSVTSTFTSHLIARLIQSPTYTEATHQALDIANS